MSAKTKIVVLKMKEIIYTAIFIGLAALLIVLFLIMFRPARETSVSTDDVLYVPGVYTSSLSLGSQNINVEVAVDKDRINSISFVSLDEAVTTMYPLMQPAMEDLEQQILNSQSLENLSYSMETRYTSQAILNAVEKALDKAKAEN